MSLSGRIIFSFGLIAIAGFAFLLNPVLDRVERQYLEAIEEPMVDVAEILAGLLSNQASPDRIVPDAWKQGMRTVDSRQLKAKIYNHTKEKVLMDFYITDATGHIVYDSGGVAAVGDDFSAYNDVHLTLKGGYGARSTKMDEKDPASSVMFVGAPLFRGKEIIGMVSVYKPQRSMLSFVIETKRRLLFLSVIALALVMLLSWLLSRWVTRPLGHLTDYAAAVAKGERPAAPQLPGYHLRKLGETTEAMREALENRKYVESYVQSMTHEMKSPVAGIRGAAELLREKLPEEKRLQFLGNIESESIRLQNLIDQLLALSSLENRSQLGSPTEISLSALAQQVIDQHASNLLDKRLKIEFLDTENDTVLGEAFLLETAISNLLQNAIDFSQPDSRICIQVSSHKHEVKLTIVDEGTGIPSYALERIFDRFYSLPRPGLERKSSGLGLCFVKESVALHGGTLSVRNRVNAKGVKATIRFPR